MNSTQTIVTSVMIMAMSFAASGQETLPLLVNGEVPDTFEKLWRAFDPRKEPLEVEVQA